jgi:hypothetical protein
MAAPGVSLPSRERPGNYPKEVDLAIREQGNLKGGRLCSGLLRPFSPD